MSKFIFHRFVGFVMLLHLMGVLAVRAAAPGGNRGSGHVVTQPEPVEQPHAVRLTCVGDSNTSWGYPERLQEELGDDWQVGNFGRGGATVIRKLGTGK